MALCIYIYIIMFIVDTDKVKASVTGRRLRFPYASLPGLRRLGALPPPDKESSSCIESCMTSLLRSCTGALWWHVKASLLRLLAVPDQCLITKRVQARSHSDYPSWCGLQGQLDLEKFLLGSASAFLAFQIVRFVAMSSFVKKTFSAIMAR